MTRQETEKILMGLLEQINNVMEDYCPCSLYWSASFSNGVLSINNDYWLTGIRRLGVAWEPGKSPIYHYGDEENRT